MIRDLPWLPRPTVADREQLASITGTAGGADLARLRKLAALGWDDSQLGAIGRRVRAALRAIGADWRSAARANGYTPFSLFIISSNTMSHLVDALRATALRAGIILDCRLVEYQIPETWLAEHGPQLRAEPPDATLLALDQKALQLEVAPGDPASAEMCVQTALARHEHIATELARLTSRAVITQTLAPSAADPQSSMDAWLPGAPRKLVTALNSELVSAARARSHPVFDAAAIAELVGLASWNAGRYRFVAKLPFDPACVPLYCDRLVQLVAAMVGKSRRVLVLDLDNTLWGGVIGDDGLEGILLGQGNARGEAHSALQRMARACKDRGVVLCVASKNTAEIALEAFRKHSEMLLKEHDFALLQINWQDKASNIKALAETLELGLDAFVFVDDNPAERKQVRDLLPTVAIPELPEDPSSWVPLIQAAAYFEQVSFAAEDKGRTEYYKANARRSAQASAIGDPKQFLASLQMVMTVRSFDAIGRARIAQLIAKSNQFNLTTRRYSESQVAALESSAEHDTLQVRLEDMFGDNGMISVVVCRKRAQHWEIDTWIMSCRVIGRGVEQAVLAVIAERSRRAGALELHGAYIPTAKNGLVRDHYRQLGFTKTGDRDDGETRWTLQLQGFAPSDVPIVTRDLTGGTLPSAGGGSDADVD